MSQVIPSPRSDISVIEVSPRDGLQNEKIPLTVDQRIDLIHQLAAAGAKRIETVAFVHPTRVPQMANAEEVMAGLDRNNGVTYSGLILNRKGLDRALDSKVDEIHLVIPATDEMSLRNQNLSVDEMLVLAKEVSDVCRDENIPLTLTVAVAFGCPFAGEVSTEQVSRVLDGMVGLTVSEVGLADTIGVGVPWQVRALTNEVKSRFADTPIRLHLHNTRNNGYANALAGFENGVTAFDSSVGGFGGCPFAPNATGNIATEDLNYLLERSGVNTGLNHAALVATGVWLSDILEKSAPALLGRAGQFPAKETA
ncbi:MAG: hydroxymethylglutaryl-CoA lyase [Actinomycetes bacterium]|jgi:hydroxymethylglutaryl-CoA lyase